MTNYTGNMKQPRYFWYNSLVFEATQISQKIKKSDKTETTQYIVV